jgi:hypothetical protein
MMPNGLVKAASNVQAHAIAQQRQLVGQGDVDRPEGVLVHLDHLGRLAAADRHHALDGLRIEGHRHLVRLGTDRPDDLVGVLGGVALVAGIDPLRRVGQEEIALHLQARGLQDGQHHLVGGAWVGRGLQTDQLPRPQIAGQLAGDMLDVLQVGDQVAGQRRGHGDDDHVHLRHQAEVGDRPQFAGLDEVGHLLVLDIGDIVLAAVDLVGPQQVLLDADDRVADLALFDGERQAHIAESDHADDGAVVGDLLHQRVDALGDALLVMVVQAQGPAERRFAARDFRCDSGQSARWLGHRVPPWLATPSCSA